MTDAQILEMLKGIAKLARPVSAEELEIHDLDVLLKDTGLDSLDFLMVGVYLSDIYGVSEEDLKAMKMDETNTMRDMINYMVSKGTKQPTSVEEALASIS